MFGIRYGFDMLIHLIEKLYRSIAHDPPHDDMHIRSITGLQKWEKLRMSKCFPLSAPKADLDVTQRLRRDVKSKSRPAGLD
jgi:hypothetical protein